MPRCPALPRQPCRQPMLCQLPAPATVMPLSTNQPLLLSLSRRDKKWAWAPLVFEARADCGSQCWVK